MNEYVELEIKLQNEYTLIYCPVGITYNNEVRNHFN